MKFRTDVTKGGYKILGIHGPDRMKYYAGVVNASADNHEEYTTCYWHKNGHCSNLGFTYDLIPITEEPPKDDERLTKLEERLEYLEDKDKKNDQRLEKLETQLNTLTLQELSNLGQEIEKETWDDVVKVSREEWNAHMDLYLAACVQQYHHPEETCERLELAIQALKKLRESK